MGERFTSLVAPLLGAGGVQEGACVARAVRLGCGVCVTSAVPAIGSTYAGGAVGSGAVGRGAVGSGTVGGGAVGCGTGASSR